MAIARAGFYSRCRIAALILLLLALPAARAGGESVSARPVPAHLDAEECPGLRLNEILPWAAAVDWNGDGAVDPSTDQWIEIYNGGSSDCDLSGWKLQRVQGATVEGNRDLSGVLAAGGYRVYHSDDLGFGLRTSAGQVRLLSPSGGADAYSYGRIDPDWSFSRVSAVSWTRASSCRPSPGGANCPADPTPTQTPRPTATKTRTPTAGPAVTATATETLTPTATVSPRLCQYLPWALK